MSFLRRRILGNSPNEASREATPEHGDELRLIPAAKLKALKELPHKNRKRRNGFVFGMGGLFGIVVAAFFAKQSDVISFDALSELNLDSLIDVLPAGVIREAKEITVWFAAQ